MRTKNNAPKHKARSAAFLSMGTLALFSAALSLVTSGNEVYADEGEEKFFLAPILQYVDEQKLADIYGPNLDNDDYPRLRADKDDGELRSEYIDATKDLPGNPGVEFTSSDDIIDNAEKVKDMGFDYIEFNLEPGLSPDADNDDVVGAMKESADAAHQEGLDFRAAPSRGYTTEYGTEIAPFVDAYHIQAQALQDKGVDEYEEYVQEMSSKLKEANPDMEISTQVSTQRGNADGLSLLETLKQCTESVMDEVDGVSVWYGNNDLDTLESFAEWYQDEY